MFRRQGITLIELVTTLAIVTVLTVMMVPNLGRWIQHYRIKGAIRDIVSQMELAKIKALKYNREYRISFDPDRGTFQLQRGNRPNSSSTWNPEGGQFTIPGQVSIDEVTFANQAAEFNPHGTATGGKVILKTRHGEQYRITVTTTTGKINTTRES